MLVLNEADVDGFEESASVEYFGDLGATALIGIGWGDLDLYPGLGGDVLIAVYADDFLDEIGFGGDVRCANSERCR